MVRTLTFGLAVLVLVVFLVAPPAIPVAESVSPPPATHHLFRGFRNVDPGYAYPLLQRAGRLLARGFERRPARGARPVVLPNDGGELRANGTEATITWVGHSTFLVQLDGVNILTDPIWSDRASPVGFAGPRRLVPPGLRFEDLPPIDAVIVSHDHFDHLDVPTVERLARVHHPRFFVPLGLRAWFADLRITDVVELDWWEASAFRGLEFTATPAQHSSGRGLRDQNLRLWASWVIAGRDKRLFFAGDTGYYDGFKEIGQRLGLFDVAAIPIGGYRSYAHHPNHVNPEEALQLFEDVRGRLFVPMHWGTFDMNEEPFAEPLDRLLKEARRRGIEEHVAPLSHGQTIHW